ncbi:hypothetical protein ElyMa_005037100 [Elysia marginata]|uniref:Uncharacterized protein n=1 Tax=Elysia marginata TaxID=1093978 RepID=A0AAV4JE15_9GAST|nr:hypothetical protein ElyMa_005037100 [Elysia marginata]
MTSCLADIPTRKFLDVETSERNILLIGRETCGLELRDLALTRYQGVSTADQSLWVPVSQCMVQEWVKFSRPIGSSSY